MKMVIVTGMSGAGKSTALNVLEDEGYYCVDNMPISLVVKFAELAAGQEEGYSDIALGIDIRSGNALGEFDEVLDELSRRHYRYKILYLDSSDEVLVKRYKETRRTHPLAKDDRVDKGIARERKKLEFLKKRADYIIDTSQLLTREFKQELEKIFIQGEHYNNLFVTVLSFGFKYGIPSDADLVFDVRFLPNPYYVSELKPLTGMIRRFRIMSWDLRRQGIFGQNYGLSGIFTAQLCAGGKKQLSYCDRLYRWKTPLRDTCKCPCGQVKTHGIRL